MGLTASILIFDRRLDNDQLASLSLVSLWEQILSGDVILTPSDLRSCVVLADTSTIIIGGGDAQAAALDDDSINLPGTVYTAAAVSSMSFADFRVMAGGKVARHVQPSESEIVIDESVALPQEADFVFPDEEEGGDVEIDSACSSSSCQPLRACRATWTSSG